MTTAKTVIFGDLRRFLDSLGYTVQRTDSAWICHQSGQNRLFFRLYREDEPVNERDLVVTRRFLDAWGILADKDFDAYLHSATTPA